MKIGNDIKVKVGMYGAWHRVTTLEIHDDKSFSICWGQSWQNYANDVPLHYELNGEVIQLNEEERTRFFNNEGKPENIRASARNNLSVFIPDD